MNGTEMEVKFCLSKEEVMRIRNSLLEECGVPKKIIEVTALYDDKYSTFLRTGETLRIRVICSSLPGIEGLKIQSASLDYKGASFGDKVNSRIELSEPIPDFLQIPEISRRIRARGMNCVFLYIKRKEEWSFLKAKTSIDDLTWLGEFLEIEGDEKEIERAVKLLNLTNKLNISKTTYQLYGRFSEVFNGFPRWMTPSIKFIL
jgi:adenylate cyclase class IV